MKTLRTAMQRAVLACAMLAAPGWAQNAATLAAQFPTGSIDSSERARAALEAVAAERTRVKNRFAREEAACYDRFFVNRCIDEVKERRRAALEQLDAIEVEAERFERGLRAEKRDADLAERRRDAAERAKEAAAMEIPPPRERKSGPPAPQGDPRAPKEKQAPLTPEQAQERAREEAANEAAYARKVQRARERQEAAAQRRAEKEARAQAQGAGE